MKTKQVAPHWWIQKKRNIDLHLNHHCNNPISKKNFKTLGFKKLDERSIWTEHMKVKNQNLKLTQATNEPRIKRKQTDQIQKIKNTAIAQWTHLNSPKQQMNPESKLLLPRVTCMIKAQMTVLGQAKHITLCRIFVWWASWVGWEWVIFGSESVLIWMGVSFLHNMC